MDTQLMKLRKAAGFSNRDEFAEKLGVNKYTYRSWESGTAMMNIEQVCMCATALGCTPNDILGWNEPDDPAISDEPMTPVEREIIEDYRQSSPEWQRNIAATAKLAADGSK